MDSRQKMDVVDWQNSPSPVIRGSRALRWSVSPTLIGILGTLLLHALVIHSLPFGRGPKAESPEVRESADSLAKSESETTESLVMVQLPVTTDSQQAAIQSISSSLPDLRKIKEHTTVQVDAPDLPGIEMLALRDEQNSEPSGDGAEQTRLLGIYTGQIQARIDRIWRRPRTPVSEDNTSLKASSVGESFQCEAQIVQDAGGNVQEILLPRCHGSAAWQRSLVLAIRQASPLSAPPSPKVFKRSVTLSFVGLPYVAGSSDDGYEIQAR